MFYIEHGEFKKAAQIWRTPTPTRPISWACSISTQPVHSRRIFPVRSNSLKPPQKQGHVLSAAHLALIYQIPEYHNYEKAFNYSKYAAEALMLLRQMDDLKI